MLTLGESEEGNMEILTTFLEAWNYKLKRNKKFKGKMKYTKKKLAADNQGLQPRVKVKSLTDPAERLCKQNKNLCPNLAKEEAVIGKTSQSLSF